MLWSTGIAVICLIFSNGFGANSQRISETKCREYATIGNVVTPTDSAPRKESILGKVATTPGEFPYMAALGWKKKDGSYDYLCGGTLIAPEFVLTAAHCVTNSRVSTPEFTVIGGGSPEAGNTESNIPIEKIHVHPEYKTQKVYNDIALIKLGSPSSNRPACLWQAPEINQFQVTATGYGVTIVDGEKSSDLLKVILDVFSNEECKRFYEKNINRRALNGIIESHVCAGDHNGTKDTCNGDAGGPFLVDVKDNDQVIPYIAGVISFGLSCGAGFPSVGTRVSSYLDWIESIVWP